MHRSVYMLMLAGAATVFAAGHTAAQDAVTLRAPVTDADGRVTLGDLFDGAGKAADVVVAQRPGQTIVLDAGQVQAKARQAGLSWSNPQGLRRIIVSGGSEGVSNTPAKAQAGATKDVLVFTRTMSAGEIVSADDIAFKPVQAHMASGALMLDPQTAIGKSVRLPVREGGIVKTSDLASPIVIKRAELVKVTWAMNGISLSMTGQAQKDAAIGDIVMVQNPQSKKLIEAVVTGPGTAVTGEAALALRSDKLYSSR
ncbi:flagellar basal body P-ring formation chaperone FlgA [Asticcacaulis sp. BYS171W]|uniref:Flagellar basal body P-ring formation chaperone FlgA n=1 Tax=Asticcacaulis aquaticus TaxID=2984212 RepID=A0ABT5HVF2_9CAUL|nr:flagellar basal body P-ring formation chaperone FlgA [Asticcacaulis aquaticus]MDC7684033.1 flagellar basal body P-ring formation chaperone FlgA [Asticcacaulis aquaticus]